MRVLYRDYTDDTLIVTEVTSTTYYVEEQILEFCGDSDFGVHLPKEEAEVLVRRLFEDGKLDLSSYQTCDVDFLFDDDDDDFEDDDEDDFEDDEDEDEDEDDVLNFFLPEDDKRSFRIPRTIRFPKK